MYDPVASPSSSSSSSSCSLYSQSSTKEDRVSEKPDAEKSTSETLSKIKILQASEHVTRKLDLGVEDMVSLEQDSQTVSESQQHKVIADLKPDKLERSANSLKKCSSYSQAAAAASDSQKPSFKAVPLSVLVCRPVHKNSNSPLGESDTDCEMLSSTDSHSKDNSNGFISKESDEIKIKQIHSSPFSSHPRYKRVVLNLLPRKKLSNNALFQSNGSDEALPSSTKMEDAEREPLASVQQGIVNKLKQSPCNNACVDKETFKCQETGKSGGSVPFTDLCGEKLKVTSKGISIHESDTLVPKLLETRSYTSIESIDLPVLSAENVRNQMHDPDTPQSDPVETLRTQQNVRAESSVSDVSTSSGLVNSADTLLCNALVEQNDRSMSVKSNVGAVQPETVQVDSGSGMIGEQEACPGMKNSMEVRDSFHTPDKQISGKDCSEIVPVNKRKISLPETKNKTTASSAGSFTILPQDGCKEIAVHEGKIKERSTIVYDNENVEKSAPVTAAGNRRKKALISETGNERKGVCELEKSGKSTSLPSAMESDHEEKCVQMLSLVDKTESKEMVTFVSEIKNKVVFELTGEEIPTLLSTDVECTSEHFSEAGTTDVTENVCKAISKNNVSKADSKETAGDSTSLPEKECVELQALKIAKVCEDKSPVVPEIETGEVSASLCSIRCKEIIPLLEDRFENTEKPMPETRLLSLQVQCREKGDKQMKQHVLNESAEYVGNEIKFHSRTVEMSSTTEFVKLTDHSTVIAAPDCLSLIAVPDPRGNSSSDGEVSLLQDHLATASPMQLLGHHILQNDTYHLVETETNPKSNMENLSVSSSEVEVVHHIEPISPSGNKENLPYMSVNTSVPESPAPSGSNVGTLKPQPLNKSTVTLNSMPTENTLREKYEEETVVSLWDEVTGAETDKSDLHNEHARLSEASMETLEQPVSVGKALNSSWCTGSQNQLQGISNECGTSVMIKTKDIKTGDTGSIIDESTFKGAKLLSTACDIRGILRSAKSISDCLTAKTRSVTKSTKKPIISKKTNLKVRAQTKDGRDSGAKLSSSLTPEASSPKFIKDCGRTVAATVQASSKCLKQLDLPTSDPQVFASATAVVTEVTSEETLPNNIKAEAVCKCFTKSTIPDELSLHEKCKRRTFKKRKIHVFGDSFQKLCVKASALLNGEWLIFFRITCMHLKLLIPYAEWSFHLPCSFRVKLSQVFAF
jgi:hypothetical protein